LIQIASSRPGAKSEIVAADNLLTITLDNLKFSLMQIFARV